MTTDIFFNPTFLGGLGAVVFLVFVLFVWGKLYPEQYKRTEKKVMRFISTGKQMFYAAGFTVSMIGLGCIAVYFYNEKAALAIQASAPELYSFIEGNILTLAVALLGFNALSFFWKMMTHHHNSLDNGKIDDPDVERRFLRTDLLVSQMEKNRREEMAQMKTAIDKLAEVVVVTQQNYYEQGKRFAENPTPPIGTQERRTIVKDDPSIPLTKEDVLAAVLPEISRENTANMEILPSETNEKATVSSDSSETQQENGSGYSKLDSFVLGKILRVKNKT